MIFYFQGVQKEDSGMTQVYLICDQFPLAIALAEVCQCHVSPPVGLSEADLFPKTTLQGNFKFMLTLEIWG